MKQQDIIDLRKQYLKDINVFIENISACQIIEATIYESSVTDDNKFNDFEYRTHMYNFLANLDPKSHTSNKSFLPEIMSKITDSVELKKIALREPHELYPEVWKSTMEIQKIRETQLQNYKKEGTTMYLCKKCKKRNTTFHVEQTRSIDEPATVFITCLECSHVWKT